MPLKQREKNTLQRELSELGDYASDLEELDEESARIVIEFLRDHRKFLEALDPYTHEDVEIEARKKELYQVSKEVARRCLTAK